MKDVESAVQKFIDDWSDKESINSVLLSGSYAVGSPSKNSDVDLIILLDDEVKWEERGNKTTDGYLIEYIAKPISSWKVILAEEEKTGKKIFSYMFSIAKIINEANSQASELVKKANSIVNKTSEVQLSEKDKEMMKYHINDRVNDLKDAYEGKSPAYNPSYYFILSTLINNYAKIEGVNTPSTAKVYKFLKNEDFRKSHKMRGFKDNKFLDKALNCYEKPSLGNILELANYISRKLGGFNQNDWKLREMINN